MKALVAELAVHVADSAVRIRLTQALAEMPGTIALDTLRQLARDNDRAVALLAAALVEMLDERTHGELGRFG
jgi:hypothetical protein